MTKITDKLNRLKVFCHVPRESWVIDRIGQEYQQFSTHDVSTTECICADVIWLLGSWMWKQVPLGVLASTPVVCTIHHVVPDKFDKDEFLLRDKYVDVYHTPCEQTKEFISKHTEKQVTVVPYWYNADLWFPVNRSECRRNFNINNNEFVIGSFQRDTEANDLKSPKLEKGPDRFCDYVIALDVPKKHILLNGWRRQYAIHRLKNAGVKYTYIELPSLETVRQMYCALDLYIVASRYEGGPQSILECAAMHIPIISTDVGMARSILSNNCIIDIEKEIYFPTEEDVNLAHTNVLQYEIRNHIQKYDTFFETLRH